MLQPAAHSVASPVPYGTFFYVVPPPSDPLTGSGFEVLAGFGFGVISQRHAFVLDASRLGWDISNTERGGYEVLGVDGFED